MNHVFREYVLLFFDSLALVSFDVSGLGVPVFSFHVFGAGVKKIRNYLALFSCDLVVVVVVIVIMYR